MSKGFKIWAGVMAASSIAMAAAIFSLPSGKHDPMFDHIKLPSNFKQCLADTGSFDARSKQRDDFNMAAEDRNSLKLSERISEAEVAVTTYRWLNLMADPTATQDDRFKALEVACEAGRNVKGRFPDFQVLSPLDSVTRGDDWVLRYSAPEYEKQLDRVQADIVKLEKLRDDFARARATPPTVVPPVVTPKPKATTPKQIAPRQQPKPAPRRPALHP